MARWCMLRKKTVQDWYSLPYHVQNIEMAILEYEQEIRSKNPYFGM